METHKNQALKTVGRKPLDDVRAAPPRPTSPFPSGARQAMLSLLLVLVIAVGAYFAVSPALKAAFNPASASPGRADRLFELAQIKDDVSPAAAASARAARVEALGKIKDDMSPAAAAMARAERIFELTIIKDGVVP